MKIYLDPCSFRDFEYIPYVGEEIISADFYIKENKAKGYNVLWLYLFKQGLSVLDIDKLLNENKI